MKVPAEKLKAAIRKKRQEASEEMRLAKRVQRKAQSKRAQASKVSVEAASAEAVPIEEPREGILTEVPASEGVPAMAETGMEERGKPAPIKGVGEGSLVVPESVVVDLDFRNGTPAPTKPAEAGESGAEGRRPAPPELEAEEIPPVVGEGEAMVMMNDSEVGPTDEGGAEPKDSPSPPTRAATQRAVKKASA